MSFAATIEFVYNDSASKDADMRHPEHTKMDTSSRPDAVAAELLALMEAIKNRSYAVEIS